MENLPNRQSRIIEILIMEPRIEIHLNHMIDRYPKLIVCREDIVKAYEKYNEK